MRTSAPMALLFVLASMMVVTNSHAQCLKLALRHDPLSGRFNPDSIMADTCYGTRTMGDGIVPGKVPPTAYHLCGPFEVECI
jgi:hypothetical protein